MDRIRYCQQQKSAWHRGSTIPNGGDFQIAQRRLWNHTKGFRWHKDLVSRDGGDSVLLMPWMNVGAVIQLPKALLYHINHGRKQVGGMTWNCFIHNVTLRIDETRRDRWGKSILLERPPFEKDRFWSQVTVVGEPGDAVTQSQAL